MIALAIGLVFKVPPLLQRVIPDYTSVLQDAVGGGTQTEESLNLGGIVNDQNKDLDQCHNNATVLESCGTAPDITGIQEWFNTPGNAAIDLKDLKGQVLLIGIHSPEYAFEKEARNVKAGAANLGITYPVALDNSLSTWTNYRNRYWPAHYLIDAKGVVRNVQFGEGNYASAEKLIRELLQEANPGVKMPASTEVADTTPTASLTPETYLSPNKVINFGGAEKYSGLTESFSFPAKLAQDAFALDGAWKLDGQFVTPREATAKVRLNYHAESASTQI